MTEHRRPPGPDVLVELQARGFDTGTLTEEQRQLIRELSIEELALLLDTKAALEDAGSEVQAHSEVAGGALF